MAPTAAAVPCITLSDGNKIPVFGLGTWQSKPGEVVQAVKDAIDLGYRHFDCAHIYENEHEVGEGLRSKIAEGVVTREQLFITSKLWNTHHRPEQVVPACKKTLTNLGLDYLDLYLIHWPMAFKEGDVLFPKDEAGKVAYSDADYIHTWPAMEECAKLGLTKSIGVSNFNSKQIQRLLTVAKIKPVMNQVECHPYMTQRKLKAFCAQHGIVITGYSPLGSPGTAKPQDPVLLQEPAIVNISKKYKKSVAQILIRYLIERGVVVIPKTVTKKRLQENIDVFDFALTSDDVATIDSLDLNKRLVSFEMVQDHPLYGFHIEF